MPAANGRVRVLFWPQMFLLKESVRGHYEFKTLIVEDHCFFGSECRLPHDLPIGEGLRIGEQRGDTKRSQRQHKKVLRKNQGNKHSPIISGRVINIGRWPPPKPSTQPDYPLALLKMLKIPLVYLVIS
jgi:hypothetical protein